ncbi:hypothetical protein BN1110_00580 [bacterium YEK0313]|nr:hypothetical protein BN1110_00580 [bacterium YEK0313]
MVPVALSAGALRVPLVLFLMVNISFDTGT